MINDEEASGEAGVMYRMILELKGGRDLIGCVTVHVNNDNPYFSTNTIG